MVQLDRDLGQGRFSRLFRTSPTPIFVQSMRNGAILDVNLAFERALGYTRQEVLSRREGDALQMLRAWEGENQQELHSARRLLAELADAKSPDLAMLSVALRKLRNLV